MSPAGVRIALWFLAGVFVLSGVAKLRRPEEVARAMVSFRLVQSMRPWLGFALGVVELAIAAMLIVTPFVGASLATGLLWLFVILIARSLRAGGRFRCSCFWETAPLSRWTLVRALLLALLAAATFLVDWRQVTAMSPLDHVVALVTAGALLGIIVAGSQVPSLFRWNAAAASG